MQLWVPLSFQVHTQDDPSPSLLVKLIPFLVSANYLSLYATTGSILSTNYYIGSILSTNFFKKKLLNIVFSHEVVNSLRASTQLEIPKPRSEHDAGCQVCIQNTRTIKLSDGH